MLNVIITKVGVVEYVNSTVVAAGAYQTFDGLSDIAQGKFKKGADKTSMGYGLLKLASVTQGLNSATEFGLLQNSVCLGLANAGWQGLIGLKDGVNNRNALEVIQAIAQTALATTGIVCIVPLQADTGHRILNTAVMIHVGYSGINALSDANKERLYKAIFAIFIGYVMCQPVVVIGQLGAQFYMEFNSFYNEPLNADETAFLSQHNHEIEQMYQTGSSTGEWLQLGEGADKRAYTHPDFPSKLLKIPKRIVSIWGEKNAAMQHYEHLEAIRASVKRSDFPNIVIPSAHVLQSTHGPYLVEQKFDVVSVFEGASLLRDNPKVYQEYERFIELNQICDINPYNVHNAGVLSRTESMVPSVAIFDFDCKGKHHFGPRDRPESADVYLVVALYLVSVVASGITDKIASARTAGGCKKLAIITSMALLILYTAEGPLMRLRGADLIGTGVMLTTTVAIGTFKSLRWLKRQLGRCCCPKAQAKPQPATLELIPT